jgi:uridine phosphorylase
MIRVGTAGSLQPGQRAGDLVIATAAVRADGVTPQYAPPEFPAVAHVDTVMALQAAATARAVRHHVGVVVSTDSFYSELEPDRLPVGPELRSQWRAYRAAGALASEMECSALFILGSVLRIRTGGLMVCVNESPMPPEGLPADPPKLDPLIDTAVDALRRLIAADRILPPT